MSQNNRFFLFFDKLNKMFMIYELVPMKERREITGMTTIGDLDCKKASKMPSWVRPKQ